MKHASPATLNQLADLLGELRVIAVLVERKPGVFYRKSRAFLHFHEDPAGLFGDLRRSAAWERFPLDTPAERARFMQAVRSAS
ncbi:hypothetical protein [Acidiphilium sp.]|uniref:hypothetical protein n=1 Tax=Acidiphilium sp. TaxID=527 RepID=UPI003CFBDC23